jgi:tetratricopeptide (TPR) repeat protein
METILESLPQTAKTRLSQSALWEYQKEFYAVLGQEAWTQKVPFFSTSNVFIARSYAHIILRFMQDWQARHGHDAEPFYIMELGAGTGLFSFYFLKQLQELQAALHPKEIPFVYVMTDFVAANIDHWRTHPALQEFMDAGRLGFAQYEIGGSAHIAVELQGMEDAVIISPEQPTQKPLIIVANYLLDSLSCDIFKIVDGQLQEGLTRPNIRPAENVEMNIGAVMDDAGFDFTYQDAHFPYYENAEYDAILAAYLQELPQANFLFPIGALDCLVTLKQMSQDKLFVIATDKGFGNNHALYMMQKPDIVLHNTAFSVMVNFHTLGEFAQRCDGGCFHQSFIGQLNTSVFSLGFDFHALAETTHATEFFIDVVSPSNLFSMYVLLDRNKESYSVDEIISHLSLFHWDPYVVNTCLPVLAARFQEMNPVIIDNLIDGLCKSMELFYYLPNNSSFFHNVGVFYQSIGDFEAALNYYQISINYAGPQDFVAYNMGLCAYFHKDYDAAIQYFTEALALGYEHNILVKGWIVQAQEEKEDYAFSKVTPR